MTVCVHCWIRPIDPALARYGCCSEDCCNCCGQRCRHVEHLMATQRADLNALRAKLLAWAERMEKSAAFHTDRSRPLASEIAFEMRNAAGKEGEEGER
jgi:hypothetical protein